MTPWALLRADQGWTNLIAEDLQWMWSLIHRTSRLQDPRLHFPAWEYILRHHRSYWKTLLQRCLQLSLWKHRDQLLIRKLHRDVFRQLETSGTFHTAPIRTALNATQQLQHFGCMMCSKRCKTKAGEGAHLFRAHGIVAHERQWITTTSCTACLKEFHTFDKLQVHLRTAQTCRRVLAASSAPAQIQPGFGSVANSQLREQHDGLLPVQQALGPLALTGPGQEVELHHVQVFETLVLDILDFAGTETADLISILKRSIIAHPISWSHLCTTLRFLADSLTEEVLAESRFSLEEISAIIHQVMNPVTWPFLTEFEHETADGEHLHALDLYEHWCLDVANFADAWTWKDSQCPRKFFRERVILHAYSGRRRPGDVQWFIDQVAAQQDLAGIIVVSLDIVIDEKWGDISRDDTQMYWLRALREGYVLGFLSGPPCCTWSVARGKQDQQMLRSGRTGPRIVRTLQELWGFLSVSLREMSQLHDGHILLGFSIMAMTILHTTGGIGILEHPGPPTDPEAASIWRLPIIQMLLALDDFQLFECAQGLLGANSAKRTGLLTLRMPSLPLHLRRNALCAEIPRAQTIGMDSEGRFHTAKLKEYPPAFCKGMAECFIASFPSVSQKDLDQLPTDFMTTCKALHCTEMGTTIGADSVAKL